MMTKRIFVSALTGAAGAFAAAMVVAPAAYAQSTTTGAIQGIVKDKVTGEPLPGVGVVATGAQGQGAPSTITDENGFYKIDGLTPGHYVVKYFFATVTVTRDDINVGVNKTTPVYITMDTNDAGEKVEITGSAPTIDPTSTTQGITIDQEYTKNIPVPGRTFESALGAAAGSQNDGVGVSFSGSSSLENQYVVDGINTTNLSVGAVGSPVINDFIQEIEVITGGYDAEYGRATGGVVNVVTKSGTNEVKGSVFAYLTPGVTVAGVQRSPVELSAVEATGNLAYNYDFGFEVGGPIIKDKLWYYVGFDPNFIRNDITRRVNSRVDCYTVMQNGQLSTCDPKNADGTPDRDPRTGFYITQPIEERVIANTATVYQALGKINGAISPEHQGQVSFFAQPGSQQVGGVFGLPQSTTYQTSSLTTDVSAKWTSKFNDNKTEIEGVVGWHRDYVKIDLADPTGNTIPEQVLINGDLFHYANWGGESQLVKAGCQNTGDSRDPWPTINQCPDAGGYSVGGAGALTDDKEQRISAKVGVTERLKAMGTHEIKAGIDAEQNLADKLRQYSGGVAISNVINEQIETFRWVQLAPMGTTDPRFDNQCLTPSNGATGPNGGGALQCDYITGDPGYPGTRITGNTFNWALYARDSWQIKPNITLNYGLRYEEQRLRYAHELQNTPDPVTNDVRGTNAMVLQGMLAPRIGLLYDWTKEGRSKLYGHWGRFYESIPMDINDRSFGGEVSYRQIYDLTKANSGCSPANSMQADLDKLRIGGPDGNECLNNPGASQQLFGAGGTLVAPNIKAQYMDELILGVEYELLEDLKLGIAFKDRRLGRVIEDVSTDGANTYVIANPGEISDADLAPLQARIMNTDDPNAKQRLIEQLNLFKGIRVFDSPQRRYDSLEFTLTRRFSKALYLQGSYTYSRTTGNYPGLVSYDNGQIDPNISSQFDLIELLSNRQGALPQDRPHYIKIDGYYTFDLKKAGQLTLGTRIRALSGIPRNVLAGHYLYGLNESFLLPRGEIGRTDFEHGIDLHIGYKRNLGRGVAMELFSDLYNLYNRQGQFYTDDTYAYPAQDNNANPIVGGTYQDLIWARRVDRNGNTQPEPLLRNKNFGNTSVRYNPLSVQFGMRITF